MGYYEEELMRQAKASLKRIEAQPRVNCPVVGLDMAIYGSPELVHQGPQPEAHKSIP